MTWSNPKKRELVDEGTNKIKNNAEKDITPEIERKINETFKKTTIQNHKGNSFRNIAKDNRDNNKYATSRDKKDNIIMLLIEQKNKINKGKEQNEENKESDNNIEEKKDDIKEIEIEIKEKDINKGENNNNVEKKRKNQI